MPSSPDVVAAEVLAERIEWSGAVFARLIERAREAGWIAGGARPAAPRTELGSPRRRESDDWLRTRLELAPNQLAALWLLACVDIDPALSRLAAAFATQECPDLSIQILQQLLPCADHAGLSGEQIEQLIELGLIETTGDHRLPSYRRWVRASDRVIEIARGRVGLDREVARFARLEPADPAAARAAELPDALAHVHDARREAALVIAVGPDGSGRATLLSTAAACGGLAVLRVRSAELARDQAGLIRQARAIARECALFAAALLIEDVDALVETDRRSERLDLVTELRRVRGPVFATAAAPRAWSTTRPVICHRMGPLSESARAAIWRAAVSGATDDVVAAAARYTITPGAILVAAQTARIEAGVGEITAAHVHAGVRTHVEHQLGTLARRVEIRQRWDDLVLPSADLEQVVELVARVRHRHQVLDGWGFADKIGRGAGMTTLLSGPPGTGKTMIAGLIANELGLDLYQIDLATIVSKYIGETEKQLAAVFDAAEAGHAVLLFDEADSLFARRSEVRSSNDRYANLEVNYLLQRIEAFTGIVLLTTNTETAIDDAFRRRLAMHIRFPLPDEHQRELLWRAMLPARASVAADVDFPALARELAMSGGYIKNAAVRAAYLAAARSEAIGMTHLTRAARAEYEAMGRIAWS